MSASWLEEHLETFVRPHLKFIPKIETDPKRDYHIRRWSPVTLKALKAVWEEAKRRSQGRQILLAGRDVWQFEVLARIEDTPTIFRPDISGTVARWSPRVVKEDYSECYLLDTGYKGSVPLALGIPNFDLIHVSPGLYAEKELRDRRAGHQVFPHAPDFPGKGDKGFAPPKKVGEVWVPAVEGRVYGLAPLLEQSQKYWVQAFVDTNNQIQQTLCPLSDDEKTWPGAFNRAAQTTQLIARYMLENRRPLRAQRRDP